MLNRVIRLQAGLEIITSETRGARTLPAHPRTQLRNTIYQSRLALDYLLAAEGGVCGKFNLTNCCTRIEDQGQAVEDLVKQLTKLARASVHTCLRRRGTDGTREPL